MNISDVVVVIGSESLPAIFLGRYGVVTDDREYKVTVEFNRSVNGMGRLSHTAFREDLLKIGEIKL